MVLVIPKVKRLDPRDLQQHLTTHRQILIYTSSTLAKESYFLLHINIAFQYHTQGKISILKKLAIYKNIRKHTKAQRTQKSIGCLHKYAHLSAQT